MRRLCVLCALAVGSVGGLGSGQCEAAGPRNEFRYEAGRGLLGRLERLDGGNWRQTDDASPNFHYWCQVNENEHYIEMESKTVPGLKNRIYDRIGYSCGKTLVQITGTGSFTEGG